MESDIVARLKDVDLFGVITLLIDARQEIERLRKERDEARRMYLASTCSDDEIIPEMKRRGWDCFKEANDDR